jgi:triacylglycerol lipase
VTIDYPWWINAFGVNDWIGQDYMKIFRDRGYITHYASVGPVSSNHDRACELYAQIKGTVVDYGQAHSSQFGHARYGRNYTGKGF